MAVGLDLDQYQLNKRVLMVFSPSPRDSRYEEQHGYVANERQVLDACDIVIFGIFENGPSFAEQRAVSHEDSVNARCDFGVEEGQFGLRLIDLDGTEILRSSEPVPVDELVELVADKVR